MMQSRFFNHIQVKPKKSTVRKSSIDTEKLRQELSWYLKIPKELQSISPKILQYNMDENHSFIDMEFYDHPTLSNMYLYRNYSVETWKKICQEIESTLHKLGKYKLKFVSTQKLIKSMKRMYEKKTYERLKSVLSKEHVALFDTEYLEINNQVCVGLKYVFSMLPKLINESDLYNQNQFSIIHGDFCFGNLLYNFETGIIYMIDPRGKFGDFDIYGDPRYDVAKLLHSIEGEYDVIVNGMFHSCWKDKNFFYNLHTNDYQSMVKNVFNKHFLKKWQTNRLQIKLIESLMFLSMVPLHADSLQAQQIFLARGLQILTQISSELSLVKF
ncbi:aminoglycoside phosphotransferase family protein [Candidatus Uabimicrobium amorphum]|uniref:Aminoglycoside phosphotransferase domain-containing protein n=1 Tax=Uabimicrobium amorphum TaxID=2596890 RepID=A0A5S9F6A8_UABAM|nr:aminoglycoside phosphotransferase family protein [Candidatus Uabimicrobium amorphum]BBM87488.1 hypothetical protein UABAM_05900 [Candidatus Uabimicrobium amorphum]